MIPFSIHFVHSSVHSSVPFVHSSVYYVHFCVTILLPSLPLLPFCYHFVAILKLENSELVLNGVSVAIYGHTKHLGGYLDTDLNFSKHIRKAVLKALKGVNLLKFLSKYINRNVLHLFYKLDIRELLGRNLSQPKGRFSETH